MRNKYLLIPSLVGGTALLVFWLGPRPEVDTASKPLALSDDLDAYLAASEAVYSDIIPGAEKTIIWADDSTKQRTPWSIVYLHGFSATRQETAPLSDTLAQRLGANLFYTRLRGHGRTDPNALAEPTVSDWLHDTREALAIGKQLGEKVIVVGVSTGATLATWLAAQPEGEDIAALVMMSPNFRPNNPMSRILTWPWSRSFTKLVIGKHREWEPANEQQGRYWTTRYPSSALITLMSLVDLVEDLDLQQVKQPTLIIYSKQDTVIDPQRIEERFPTLGAEHKRLLPFAGVGDRSNHVLAGDILSPETTLPLVEEIEAFLAPLLQP